MDCRTVLLLLTVCCAEGFEQNPTVISSHSANIIQCVAKEFVPKKHDLKWLKNEKDITSEIDLPFKVLTTVSESRKDGKKVYNAESLLIVNSNDVNEDNEFNCVLTGGQNASLNKTDRDNPVEEFEQNPTLKVLSSFIEDGTYTISCFAKEFAPKKHDIKWLKDRTDITSKIDLISTVSESRKADGKKVYNAASFLIVNSSEVNEDTEFTCVFTGGQSGSLNKTDRNNTLADVSTTADLTNSPTVAVHILPQLHTYQLNPQDEITLVCLVTSAVNKMYKIEWSESYGRNSGHYVTGTNVPAQQSKNDKKWRSMSLYTTSKQNWDKKDPNKIFTCHVRSENIHKSVSSFYGNLNVCECDNY